MKQTTQLRPIGLTQAVFFRAQAGDIARQQVQSRLRVNANMSANGHGQAAYKGRPHELIVLVSLQCLKLAHRHFDQRRQHAKVHASAFTRLAQPLACAQGYGWR